MSYNILKMHRRKLRKFEMDQLSEHIQQNLSKNFEYEDDEVIDRLRDVMYELRSNRLASPGPAPGMVIGQQRNNLYLIYETRRIHTYYRFFCSTYFFIF